ncbi:MAG: glycosyltransferase [Patescibacteria group bacterium]
MEKSKIKISVLMSVYNEKEEYLRRAIRSILFQTFPGFEFIIVDDGSTEKKCCEILEEYAKIDPRVTLIKNEKNLGLTKSLNKGIRTARGELIARIDSDDIADVHRLENQLEFMEKNKNYALCGSWSYLIDGNGDIIEEKKLFTDYEKIKKNLLFFNFFTHSSIFFRKDIIEKLGGYNEKLKKAQDYDLILKISAHHAVANIPKFLCFNRIWPESITSKTKKKQEWYGLIARWHAIWSYGYPKRYFFKIIPSVLYFLFIPHFLEKKLFKLIWK